MIPTQICILIQNDEEFNCIVISPPLSLKRWSVNFQAAVNDSTLISFCVSILKSSTGIKSKEGNINLPVDTKHLFTPITEHQDTLTSYNKIESPCFYKFFHARLNLSLAGYRAILKHTLTAPLSASVVKSSNIVEAQLRHDLNQCNKCWCWGEPIPLVLSLFKMQCRDQMKRPACSGSLKGQTAETKAITESMAEVIPRWTGCYMKFSYC